MGVNSTHRVTILLQHNQMSHAELSFLSSFAWLFALNDGLYMYNNEFLAVLAFKNAQKSHTSYSSAEG